MYYFSALLTTETKPQNSPQYSFLRLVFRHQYDTTLLQILISLRFPIHLPEVSNGALEKRAENFAKLPSTSSMAESFSTTLEAFPVSFLKYCLQQLSSRELVSTCFCGETPLQTLS